MIIKTTIEVIAFDRFSTKEIAEVTKTLIKNGKFKSRNAITVIDFYTRKQKVSPIAENKDGLIFKLYNN